VARGKGIRRLHMEFVRFLTLRVSPGNATPRLGVVV
jgi:hypothetical protein